MSNLESRNNNKNTNHSVFSSLNQTVKPIAPIIAKTEIHTQSNLVNPSSLSNKTDNLSKTIYFLLNHSQNQKGEEPSSKTNSPSDTVQNPLAPKTIPISNIIDDDPKKRRILEDNEDKEEIAIQKAIAKKSFTEKFKKIAKQVANVIFAGLVNIGSNLATDVIKKLF